MLEKYFFPLLRCGLGQQDYALLSKKKKVNCARLLAKKGKHGRVLLLESHVEEIGPITNVLCFLWESTSCIAKSRFWLLLQGLSYKSHKTELQSIVNNPVVWVWERRVGACGLSGAKNLPVTAFPSCFHAAADHSSGLLCLPREKQFHERRNSEFPMETPTSNVQCKYSKC